MWRTFFNVLSQRREQNAFSISEIHIWIAMSLNRHTAYPPLWWPFKSRRCDEFVASVATTSTVAQAGKRFPNSNSDAYKNRKSSARKIITSCYHTVKALLRPHFPSKRLRQRTLVTKRWCTDRLQLAASQASSETARSNDRANNKHLVITIRSWPCLKLRVEARIPAQSAAKAASYEDTPNAQLCGSNSRRITAARVQLKYEQEIYQLEKGGILRISLKNSQTLNFSNKNCILSIADGADDFRAAEELNSNNTLRRRFQTFKTLNFALKF